MFVRYSHLVSCGHRCSQGTPGQARLKTADAVPVSVISVDVGSEWMLRMMDSVIGNRELFASCAPFEMSLLFVASGSPSMLDSQDGAFSVPGISIWGPDLILSLLGARVGTELSCPFDPLVSPSSGTVTCEKNPGLVRSWSISSAELEMDARVSLG